MRTTATLFSFLLITCTTFANSLYDQLRAFNPAWEKQAARLGGLAAVDLHGDVDYVRAHLEQVLGVLADAPTDQLSTAQRTTRRRLLAALADYARQGRFPLNTYRPVRTPVFIDERDTHCAVAYLMQCSGHEVLARRIAATDDLAWVRDITDPELPAWQVASGFSLDELKLIQGAYDFYLEDAFLLPDKYEVPQRPEQVVRYFEGADKDKVWCKGEGENGVLNGRWVQNYSSTLPWIEGFYERGERSGMWKEYFKGTDRLCRTEHWRNGALNGLRTRYDREGRVIETILFKHGRAITKTNFDHDQALQWVRTPLDSTTVRTEVLTDDGALIAEGREHMYVPPGLQWFQNIELTALNTMAMAVRDQGPSLGMVRRPSRYGYADAAQLQLPGAQPLAEYSKDGEWVYYKDYLNGPGPGRAAIFAAGYKHFGPELYTSLTRYDHWDRTASYDSIRVVYDEGHLMDLIGFAEGDQDHFHITYYEAIERTADPAAKGSIFELRPWWHPRRIAQLDADGDLIGMCVDFGRNGSITREQHFLVPFKNEEEELGVVER